MTVARRIARPLLAGYFIYRGVQLLRNPEQGLASAQRLNQTVANVTNDNPTLAVEPSTLVKATGLAQLACGSVIALGRYPRPAALTLAAITVPYALSDFPFWEQEDPQLRDEQLTGLLADLSMVGGLLLAAVDTAGKPSLAWRTRTTAKHLPKAATSGVHHAKRDAKLATHAAKAQASSMANTVAKDANAAARKLSDAVSDTWEQTTKKVPVGSSSSAASDLAQTVREQAKHAAARAAQASKTAQKEAVKASKQARKQAKNFPWGTAKKKARELLPV